MGIGVVWRTVPEPMRRLIVRLLHLAYGVISGIAVDLAPTMGYLNVAFFHIYEFTEYFKRRDTLYPELAEFYAGFALATFVRILATMAAVV